MGPHRDEEPKLDPDGFEERKWDPGDGNQKLSPLIVLNSVSWDGVLISKRMNPMNMANPVSNGSEYAHSDDDEKICTGLREPYVPARNQLGKNAEDTNQTHVR